MKNLPFAYLLTVCFAILIGACEKTADQASKGVTTQSSAISPRTILTECDECPIGCCCCGIESVSPSSGFNLEICGLCEGDYHCGPYSPNSPCSTFSGLGKNVMFTTTHVKEIICIEPGASFRIYNPSGGTTVYFRFSCQYDVTNPSFVNVSLTPGEFKYFHNDGECISEGPCTF